VAGARPAAPIASAWAVMRHLGVDGYVEITRELMETAARVRHGIAAIDGLGLVGDPIGPVLAIASSTVDLAAVGDVMDDRGWHLNRLVDPPGLHLMLSPAHAGVVDELLVDLRGAVANPGDARGGAVRYS
jgi:glutamate/tyrosine decarboxylase-like PLP-dependent enzyme